MLITKATGATETKMTTVRPGENGAWLMRMLWARNTSVDTIQVTKKAIQKALRLPCLVWMLETASDDDPCQRWVAQCYNSQEPQQKLSLFMASSKKNPSPQVIAKVTAKKATI